MLLTCFASDESVKTLLKPMMESVRRGCGSWFRCQDKLGNDDLVRCQKFLRRVQCRNISPPTKPRFACLTSEEPQASRAKHELHSLPQMLISSPQDILVNQHREFWILPNQSMGGFITRALDIGGTRVARLPTSVRLNSALALSSVCLSLLSSLSSTCSR